MGQKPGGATRIQRGGMGVSQGKREETVDLGDKFYGALGAFSKDFGFLSE